jgi:hypothetical protein
MQQQPALTAAASTDTAADVKIAAVLAQQLEAAQAKAAEMAAQLAAAQFIGQQQQQQQLQCHLQDTPLAERLKVRTAQLSPSTTCRYAGPALNVVFCIACCHQTHIVF